MLIKIDGKDILSYRNISDIKFEVLLFNLAKSEEVFFYPEDYSIFCVSNHIKGGTSICFKTLETYEKYKDMIITKVK